MSFTAEHGTATFLVGETGSGKSTIFKLALKSIEPGSGRILVDGTDLAVIDRADWYASSRQPTRWSLYSNSRKSAKRFSVRSCAETKR
ncbi:ATP-binding cassette domain-containing protein [Rhizobium binxianense]